MEKRAGKTHQTSQYSPINNYLKFFGLKKQPFSITPDPQFLVPIPQSHEVMAHLLYSLSSDGIIVVTGLSGSGKTTMAKCFIQEHQKAKNVNFAYVHLTHFSLYDFLKEICHAFSISLKTQNTPQELFRALESFLIHKTSSGKRLILLVDEAQSLTHELLETIRALTNIEANGRKLLQIILLGQNPLKKLLSHPGMTALEQRVVARYQIHPLKPHDYATYLETRLYIAGAKESFFTQEAMELIGSLSRGIPRKMNILAERSLLAGYIMSSKIVNSSLVRQAYIDLKNTQLLPFYQKRLFWWISLGFILSLLVLGGIFLAWSFQSSKAQAKTLLEENQKEASNMEALKSLSKIPVRTPYQILKELIFQMKGEGDSCVSQLLPGYHCYELDYNSRKSRTIVKYNFPMILNWRLPDEGLLINPVDTSKKTLPVRDAQGNLREIPFKKLYNAHMLLPVPDDFSYFLKEGDKNSYVAWLGVALKQYENGVLGYPSYQFQAKTFDSSLKERIMTFQKQEGLNPDGLFGLQSYIRLLQNIAPKEHPFPSLKDNPLF